MKALREQARALLEDGKITPDDAWEVEKFQQCLRLLSNRDGREKLKTDPFWRRYLGLDSDGEG